ncbi:hypothetical protein Dsin_013336 [Dipteronia sinensis]|uniref:Uncharacterized protein n=1 Tax=Dipteronia sinensis TaxID=43782 RepID=A0AAE0E8W4_9ROSI|nr:hypothetical protein Dsin_013336 [Dipteronia sinensis]
MKFLDKKSTVRAEIFYCEEDTTIRSQTTFFNGTRRSLFQIFVGIATKLLVGLKHIPGTSSRLGILVNGIFLKMCDQMLFIRLLFVRKLEGQKRKDLNLPGNMEMERPEIVRFVKNLVTTDRIVRILNHVRLLNHVHLQHLQHRSDHIDRTGVGNVEKKTTIHINVHCHRKLVVRLRY